MKMKNKARNPFTEKDYIPSFSFLKALSIENNSNPQKAVYKWLNPEPSTKDQIFGLAIEKLISYKLDVYEFKKDFIIFEKPSPNQTMGAKINKQALFEANKEAEKYGKYVIDNYSFAQADLAAQSVLSDKRVLNLLSDNNLIDIQKLTRGSLNDMEYKGYYDIKTKMGNNNALVDIKTCTSAGYNFLYQAKKNFYDVQLSSYMNSESIETGIFLAVEVKPPYSHNLFIFQNDSETYVNALNIFAEWLNNFRIIKENKVWDLGYDFYNSAFFPFEIKRYIEDE